MEEIWKVIDGYDGRYEVSNQGRVKSLAREYKSGNNNSIKKLDEIVLKPSIDKDYHYVSLGDGVGGKKRIGIHRLVAQAFIENPDNKPQVNHKHGIKSDNRASELEWVTISENAIHAFSIGLRVGKGGEDCNFSKLTNDNVLQIRNLKDIKNVKEISIMFNMSAHNVRDILNNKIWKH